MNLGPTIPVQFEANNHVSWRPAGIQQFGPSAVEMVFKVRRSSLQRQDEHRYDWREMPSWETNAHGESAKYLLVLNSNVPGQADWRWCNKCPGLFFAGNPGSKCPAGGAHDKRQWKL
jgi:hypothetical protein